MKIRYIFPGVIGQGGVGGQELQNRQSLLQKWAFPGTMVDAVALDEGPTTIESAYEKHLSIFGSARAVATAQKEGCDAAIIGCFGDAGLDGLREVSDMLVVGPASASFALASTLCHRFSVITIVPGLIPVLRQVAWDAGVLDKVASIRAVDLPVVETSRNPMRALKRMIAEGATAVHEDGAEALVLGCMTMGFLDVAQKISSELGVPVVNPVKAALKVAESLAGLDLRHSRKAYVFPKKMQSGKALHELFVR